MAKATDTLTDDERAALKELFELVDTKLAPHGTPPSSVPKEAWDARACLKRLEEFQKSL